MAKRTKKKSKLAPRVKEVVLPKSSVLRVKAPPGVKQVVAVDHEEQVVEIVTFPKAPDEKKYWWQTLLGL